MWPLLVAAMTVSAADVVPVVPFIEDDYRRAVQEARRRNLPLFIDTWAPWCHACASMHAFVYPDPALKEVADQYVWLRINTERPEAVHFLEKFPVEAWPTLLVFGPGGERPLARWVGSLSASELVLRLKSLQEDHPHLPGQKSSTEDLLRLAQLEEAAGRRAVAEDLYRRALALEPHGEGRAAVAEPLIAILESTHPRQCAHFGIEELPRLPQGTRYASVAATTLSCALATTSRDPDLVAKAEGPVRSAVDDPKSPLLADDRSALFALLVEARRAAKDPKGVRKVAEQWAAFLETQAAAARNPTARAVFDSHRLLAYEAAGQPERALPMLEQSEKDFPKDYNPPARRAGVLLKLGKPEEALAAARRARSLVYGPRSLRVLLLEADALRELGRRNEAQKTLRDAESLVARLPAPQRQPNLWKLLDDARRDM
nr:thiol:disulfide interchange protein DsbD [uncultured bacterium]